MSGDLQHTLAAPAAFEGVALHTGARVRLRILPADPGAEADAGIVFRRVDLPGAAPIPAHVACVSTTRLGTTLTGPDGASAATVEHLLAALTGLGIDAAVIELDGPEIPILDGCAEAFTQALAAAGVRDLGRPRRRWRITRAVEVRDGPKSARLEPGPGWRLDVTIDFPAPAIGRQSASLDWTEGAFAREIAWARTFAFAAEIDQLREMGLARGGALDNAIVVDGDRVLNPEGLRAPDEFARHKLLDAVGDLALAGRPLIGAYRAEQPGHTLNIALLRALFAEEGAAVPA